MIQRISASKFPISQYRDPDIVDAFKWFRAFISDADWDKRRLDIERAISYTFQNSPPFSRPLTEGSLLSVKDDKIGWYMYLVYTFLYEPYKYECYQGARIVPIFKRIGMNLGNLKAISGINKKVRKLIKNDPSQADAVLFEILTALLWTRNGWCVKFIEEGKDGKTPDLLATKNGKSWQIECKRHQKTNSYAYEETAKRQIMISHIGGLLIERNIILNIIFHVELISLPDTYLLDLLKDKLSSAAEGILISDDEIHVEVSFVNLKRINQHLENKYVKDHSPQLLELIAKKTTDYFSFTCGVMGNFFRVGDGDVSNVYVEKIDMAFGVHCYCDAKQALSAKARDIKRQINDALQQFNKEPSAVVHIGMETFDGPEVERIRVNKILESMKSINPEESNLRWVFCHFFQSYSTPDKIWVYDETVDQITGFVNQAPPIENLFIVVDGSDVRQGDYHWNRSAR